MINYKKTKCFLAMSLRFRGSIKSISRYSKPTITNFKYEDFMGLEEGERAA